jgi:hypothetical protein
MKRGPKQSLPRDNHAPAEGVDAIVQIKVWLLSHLHRRFGRLPARGLGGPADFMRHRDVNGLEVDYPNLRKFARTASACCRSHAALAVADRDHALG